MTNKESITIQPRGLEVSSDPILRGSAVQIEVTVVNGNFSSDDMRHLAQLHPEYDGQRIEWLPTQQSSSSVKSSLNTLRKYVISGRLHRAVQSYGVILLQT